MKLSISTEQFFLKLRRGFYWAWQRIVVIFRYEDLRLSEVQKAFDDQIFFSDDGDKDLIKESRVNILAFSYALDRTGASISLNQLMRALKDSGNTVKLVSFEDGPLRHLYEDVGISVTVIDKVINQIPTLRRLAQEVDRIKSIILKEAPRVVFVNTLLNFPVILAARKLGIPSIWNIREGYSWKNFFNFLPRRTALVAAAAIYCPKKVIFVSSVTRRLWSSFENSTKFELIPNSVNEETLLLDTNSQALRSKIRKQYEIQADDLLVLSVGTLCDRKNQMDLLQAYLSLSESIAKKVHIIFVGNASLGYGRDMLKYVLSFHPSYRVNIHFLGEISEVNHFYIASDLFVFTSKSESHPRAMIEAMLFGLPIISTPLDEVSGLVSLTHNALIYEIRDCLMLAKHIEWCLYNRNACSDMGTNSKLMINKMNSFSSMMLAYESVIYNI